MYAIRSYYGDILYREQHRLLGEASLEALARSDRTALGALDALAHLARPVRGGEGRLDRAGHRDVAAGYHRVSGQHRSGYGYRPRELDVPGGRPDVALDALHRLDGQGVLSYNFV